MAHNNTPIVKLLLQHGANIDRGTIYQAAKHASIEIMSLLLDCGVNIDLNIGLARNTPLIIAVEAGRKDMVELLLEHGADPNLCNTSQVLAIELAIEKGYQQIIKLLLNSEKADINWCSGKKNRPILTIAAVKRDIKLVEFLLHYGANIQARDSTNETALITVQFECRGP